MDRLLPPLQRCGSVRAALPRGFLATLFFWAGVRAGIGYAHMCEAGSRWIEGGAALGVPLAAAGWVLVARRLWLASFGAGLLILAAYALQQPYLAWAHRGMRTW